MTVLAGGRVVTPGGILDPGWLQIIGPDIAAVGAGAPPPAPETGPGGPGEERVDLGGFWVLPGMIDLHVHGGGGATFTDGDPRAVARAAGFHRRGGTTRTLASLVTAPLQPLLRATSRLADACDAGVVSGIHLEGPFLSRLYCGAHDPDHLLAPDRAVLGRLLEAGRGNVRMVTLAPEAPGALELVGDVVRAGAVAAVGHSAATYDETMAAFDAGATVATHLFCAMRPPHHREPGVAGAALDRPGVVCEVIADGVHLHPAVLRSTFAQKGGDVALVTDAISAAGVGDGSYRLGTLTVVVTGGTARLPSSDALAGSTLTSGGALRHAVRHAGLPIVDVVSAASQRPARVLGLDQETGTLQAGKAADVVVADESLSVVGVAVAGVWQDGSVPRSAGRSVTSTP